MYNIDTIRELFDKHLDAEGSVSRAIDAVAFELDTQSTNGMQYEAVRTFVVQELYAHYNLQGGE